MDSLTTTYFVLFVAGAGFSVLSWLLGAHGHAHGHSHAGGGHVHAGGAHGGGAHAGGGAHGGAATGAHAGGAATGGAHGGAAAGAAHADGAHGAATGSARLGAARGGSAQSGQGRGGSGAGSAARFLLVPIVNLSALAALACVGGGAGYLARRAGMGALGSLAVAAPSGLAAAYAIGGLVTWLQRGTRYQTAYNFAGTVATVLQSIKAGGTGEVVYNRDGARYALAATSSDGRAIEKGTEVIVVEVDGGIARVTPSKEVFGEEPKS